MEQVEKTRNPEIIVIVKHWNQDELGSMSEFAFHPLNFVMIQALEELIAQVLTDTEFSEDARNLAVQKLRELARNAPLQTETITGIKQNPSTLPW